MASTNFLTFNPTQANQESDSAYNSDSLRSGGIAVDNIMPSAMMNKLFYQGSVFYTAFATALANYLGTAVVDTSESALQSQFATFIASAIGKASLVTVAYSGTPVFPAGTANGFSMTLSGNVTSSTITGYAPGQVLTFELIQDATGGRTFVPPSFINGWEPIRSAANAVTVQTFQVNIAGTAADPIVTQVVDNVTAIAAINSLLGGLTASLVANGYMYIPIFGGSTKLLIQWGKSASSGGSGTATSFNTTFPNAVFAVIVNPTGTTSSNYCWSNNVTNSGFNLVNNGTSPQAYWIAIGW